MNKKEIYRRLHDENFTVAYELSKHRDELISGSPEVHLTKKILTQLSSKEVDERNRKLIEQTEKERPVMQIFCNSYRVAYIDESDEVVPLLE